MKANSSLLSVIGLLACSLAAPAQDNSRADQRPAFSPVDVYAAPTYSEENTILAQEAALVGGTGAAPEPAAFEAGPADAFTTAEVEDSTGTEGSADTAAPIFADAEWSEPVVLSEAAMGAAEWEAVESEPMADDSELYTQEEEEEIIPIIVMDDVPLIDAIKNLARQANLNYIMDPKVPYGSIGPDGQPVPQPSISIRWEKLTAGQALNALLNNYNLQITEDPKTKIARITVRDPEAPDPLVTEVLQLNYTDPAVMAAHVQTTLTDKRSKVVADTRTSQLVVLATEKEIEAIQKLVVRLDSPTKQVLIEAHIVETTMNPRSVKGINWADTLSEQRFTFGNGRTEGTTTRTIPGGTTTTTLPGGRTVTTTASGSKETVLDTFIGNGGLSLDTMRGFSPSTAFLNADGVSAALSFLNSHGDSEVVSSPKTVTLDNEAADISVTRAIPIFETTAGTQGSPGGAQVTYTNIGTILRVTPRISADNYVFLKVAPEVSNVGGTDEKTVAGTVNQANIYDIRRIETQVLIPSGNTLVMGGLVSDDSTKGYTKVPLLGDIPLLGLLFRHETKDRLKKNLLVFVTPTIVQDTDFQPAQTTFLNNKIKPLTDDKLSAWDSGKPHDWSKGSAYDESIYTR